MIEVNRNTQYIGHAHTLDDVKANNTFGADGVVDVKSSGGKLPVNTDSIITVI